MFIWSLHFNNIIFKIYFILHTGLNSWGFDHVCWLEKSYRIRCQLELAFPLGREIVTDFFLEQDCCDETIIISVFKKDAIISYAGSVLQWIIIISKSLQSGKHNDKFKDKKIMLKSDTYSFKQFLLLTMDIC